MPKNHRKHIINHTYCLRAKCISGVNFYLGLMFLGEYFISEVLDNVPKHAPGDSDNQESKPRNMLFWSSSAMINFRL